MTESNPTPPVPPTVPYGNAASAPAYGGPAPDANEKQMAMLAHLLGILGPIPPLIIWLLKKDTMPFVADQAKEVLNFMITLVFAMVALVIVSIIVHFIPVLGFIIGCLLSLGMLAAGVGAIILCIMGGMKAKEGIAYRYPFAIRLIK